MNLEVKLRLKQDTFELHADFCAPVTETIGILGASGSGKTTLLRSMAGLESACSGELRLGDQQWQDRSSLVPPHLRSIGFVFQEPGLFPHLTVRGNILFGLNRTPDARRKISLDQAIGYLDLENLLERLPDKLSGGEKQRVAIARALLTSPSLLLMDEPLAGLDPLSKSKIIERLIQVRNDAGIPIVYVSHIAEEVARLCDYLVLLERGRVRAQGYLKELLTQTDLPLASSLDACAVIDCEITGHNMDYHLSELSFPGGRLWISGTHPPHQKSTRVRIMARDISITLEPARHSSILNVLPAKIESLAQVSQGQVLVRLDLNGCLLLARITEKSKQTLNLQVNQPVFAQIKSVAVLD